MGPRTVVELLHVIAGLAATVAITSVSAWGVPRQADPIWWTGLVCGVIVAAMGVRPLREAHAADLKDRPTHV